MVGSTISIKDSIRVLLVDDEASQAEMAKLGLTDVDPSLNIETVLKPTDALELIRYGAYECVVSDYEMPFLNGVKLCREIKKFSRIPFIIYTGRGSEEVASAAFEAGADDYVRKERELSHYQLLAKRIRHTVEERRFEELYRASVEDNRDGFNIVQGNEIVYANRAMAEMLGVDSPKELIGTSIMRWIVEMERGPFGEGYLEHEEELEPRVFEYLVRRIDGEIRTFEASISPITYKGEPADLVFNRDITERKEREEEMVRLSSFPRLDPNPILEADLAGRIHYLNPTAMKLFPELKKLGSIAPLNLDWENIIAKLHDNDVRDVVEDVEINGEWYSFSLQLVPGSESVRIYVTNIGERKRAMDRLGEIYTLLRKSEDKLKETNDELETLRKACGKN